MNIAYLEIVTPNVDETCEVLSRIHEAHFSDPVAALGNARTAPIPGGRVGVRAPMHESESPVVRPYWAVADAEAALNSIQESGAEPAHPAMALPGEGTFAIALLGGIQHGLWQD
ncbi:MAG: hydroxylase [Xanthomonadales bacterium]|nr:hydroxylase [Xanthomonadales bacterium]